MGAYFSVRVRSGASSSAGNAQGAFLKRSWRSISARNFAHRGFRSSSPIDASVSCKPATASARSAGANRVSGSMRLIHRPGLRPAKVIALWETAAWFSQSSLLVTGGRSAAPASRNLGFAVGLETPCRVGSSVMISIQPRSGYFAAISSRALKRSADEALVFGFQSTNISPRLCTGRLPCRLPGSIAASPASTRTARRKCSGSQASASNARSTPM